LTIIVTHDYADFDALAALVAAAKIYPESKALLPEGMEPEAALFVEEYGEGLPLYRQEQIDGAAAFQIAVVVDTRRKRQLAPFLPLLERAAEVHIFDHHPPAEDDIEGNEIRVEQVGAVTTLLVEEIRHRRLPLSEAEVLLFMLGIYRDTASLSSTATTPRDASAVAFLWEQGVVPAHLQKYLSTAPSQEPLLEMLLRRSKLYEISGRRVLLTVLPAGEQSGGGAALLRRIQEVEEYDLVLRLAGLSRGGVSFFARTTEDDLDLKSLFAPFGGTGGRREVMAYRENEDLPTMKERILESLEQFLPPPVTALQLASTPVAAVDIDATVAEADEYLEDKGYGGGPVLRDGRVAGVITRRELQRVMRSGLGDVPVKDFIGSHLPVTAAPEITATALRRLFAESGAEKVVLVDGDGRPLGLVSPIDILQFLYRLDRRPSLKLGQGSILGIREDFVPTEVDNLAGLIACLLPFSWQSFLLLMGQKASEMGVSIYLVGGVIRDMLLGSEPSRDLDFVVIPDAVDFAATMARYLDGELKTFERFGTASLFLKEGLRLDFATARQEIYDAPGALPRAKGVGSLKRDLYRRDFTINTLACSLMPESYGELYDYFEGREDLHKGVIRTLYQLSFVDDPLRLLRAVRFEQRFGFHIEDDTRALIEKAVRERVLERVSRSRLAQEISLIYAESDPVAVLKRLDELGILGLIYPRLSPDRALWQRLRRISETTAGARQREWSRHPEEELLYLSAMLLEMAPQDRLAIIRRLGLSRRRAGAVLQGCETVPPLLKELEDAGHKISPGALVDRLDTLCPEALCLLYALTTSSAVKDNLRLYLESLQFVRPRLRGNSLQELGLQPGPLYGEIMGELRRAVLDGELRGEDEELRFVRSYLQRRKEG